jgi:Tetratricopeptide repeat
MLRRYGILGACAVLVLASALWAREGTVYVKNPKMDMHGDITEHDTTVDVVNGGTTVTFQKSNVTIVYNDDVPNLIAERLAKLQPSDVQGRIDLAQFALDFKRYDDAKQILTGAQKIDPGNSRVSNMLASIDQLSHAQPPQTVPATPPATPPGTPPNPSDAGGNTGGPTTSAAPLQLREVTPDEINKIRLAEWEDDQLKVHVHIDADTRKQFIDESGMPPADFLKMTPAQQAWLIFTKGDKDMVSGIHMLSDPPALFQYRTTVHREVVSGCAASSCHGDKATGSFRLFPGDSDAAVYTDFLILNKFGLAVDGKDYPMINRVQPSESLLLSDMLTPDLATVPHPKVDGYRGMCHTRSDPKYTVTLTWIRDVLRPDRPTYDIDLTKPPLKDDKSVPPPPGQ